MTTQPNPASSADSPGSGVLREGRYRLRSKLGQGGMGSVYLAEDTLLPGRLVAVKENADSSADAQAQFKREALLLARLRHSNLPQVMDYFIEADGKQYLVMDYVPGDNLLELMRKRQGPLPAAEALAIVEQVMQALAYMHTWRDPDSGRTRPIINRDIKPANIKRTPEGRVVLVDFGIAKVDSGTMTGTAVSAKALTPGYAPLEQYGGGTDARSDIYSLGATLYALLTGKAPPSATDMAMAADKQRAPLLTGLKAAPPAAAKVIERAMQSLPKDRYQSIDAMYQALYNRPLPVTGIVNPPPPAHQGMASSRQLGWLVGALGVLLAVGMGWLLFAQSNEVPAAPVAMLPVPSPITPTLPPATTPAARATAGQSARAAEPPTSAPTPEPSDTATSAPTETPAEAPSATASATPIPTATLRPTATSAPRPTVTRTPTPRPTATKTVQTSVATATTSVTPLLIVTRKATETATVTLMSTPAVRTWWTIFVRADQGWQDTGVEILSGERLLVSDISGLWSPWSDYSLDYHGCIDPAVCSQDRNQPSNFSSVALHAALIAKIGNAEPFAVENGDSIDATTSGNISLRINDLILDDNSGALTIRLQIAAQGDPP